VPMWARFMRVATKNDGETWFRPPSDVVPVEVCRVSGALPVEGCRNAAAVSPDGQIKYKSMVYTEYFVRGTEPQHTCAEHAVQYIPYPEPYFAASAFDGLESLPIPPALPDPVPAAAPIPIEPAPVSPRRVPDLPAAPPEPKPEPPQTVAPVEQNPASALPPPAPPEPSPVP